MLISARLALAAQMCAGAQRLIEIGCDHARLSAYAVLNGVPGALACDLRGGPLARAAHTVEACSLGSKIELRLSDGLKNVHADEGDTIAICGMGGELISAILAASPWALEGRHKLVLQPQSRETHLREFLADHGCGINREALARDGGKLYCVISARGGARSNDKAAGTGAGQMFMFTEKLLGDALFPEFLGVLVEKRRKIIEGRRRGGLDFSRDAKILEMLEKYQNAT